MIERHNCLSVGDVFLSAHFPLKIKTPKLSNKRRLFPSKQEAHAFSANVNVLMKVLPGKNGMEMVQTRFIRGTGHAKIPCFLVTPGK